LLRFKAQPAQIPACGVTAPNVLEHI
jgi:hypothetical protein